MVIIHDHISFPLLSGSNPLNGANDERLGVRFPAVKYDQSLINLALKVADEVALKIHVGVYGHVGGPSYETRGEGRLLRLVGADIVGMSTVPEVIVASHAGIPLLGLSLVTNVVPTEDHDQTITSHEEVLAASRNGAAMFQNFVYHILEQM